jgi:cytidine deaminase
MQRLDTLGSDDRELIEAAARAIGSRFKPNWHVVGAALRTRTGEIVTGIHLEASVGRIAVCAEAIALGRAATELGSTEIDTIVAVYHAVDGAIRVVAPCGMCRELISDYAPDARVIIPAPGDTVCVEQVQKLLPVRYRRQ